MFVTESCLEDFCLLACSIDLQWTQISNLTFPYEPSDVRRHLYLCGFELGEDALEVHTLWVRSKINHFSSRSMRP